MGTPGGRQPTRPRGRSSQRPPSGAECTIFAPLPTHLDLCFWHCPHGLPLSGISLKEPAIQKCTNPLAASSNSSIVGKCDAVLPRPSVQGFASNATEQFHRSVISRCSAPLPQSHGRAPGCRWVRLGHLLPGLLRGLACFMPSVRSLLTVSSLNRDAAAQCPSRRSRSVKSILRALIHVDHSSLTYTQKNTYRTPLWPPACRQARRSPGSDHPYSPSTRISCLKEFGPARWATS